ncbi:hypothetical protein B0T10DRAFT_239828 [Thelonectria olida]|uniref:Uncharacterized protein n=1 Tax=Thelonectria olida TaxID=1576542 RepID=A0A9P9ATA7_9HYPO|nr:hypothetical protein B0T10DRAFT_239828 [Thelonectria olida]
MHLRRFGGGLKPLSQTNLLPTGLLQGFSHADDDQLPLPKPPWRSAYVLTPTAGCSREHPQGRPITKWFLQRALRSSPECLQKSGHPERQKWFARCVAGYPASTLSVQGISEGGLTTPTNNNKCSSRRMQTTAVEVVALRKLVWGPKTINLEGNGMKVSQTTICGRLTDHPSHPQPGGLTPLQIGWVFRGLW